MNIPKNIHLIYKNQLIPSKYQKFLNSIKKHNLGWNITIYDDLSSRLIVKSYFPELLDIYDNYEYNVQRTDFFRIIVVFIFGGFYMDLDMLCLKSLDDLCNKQIVLGEEKSLSNSDRINLKLAHSLRIANYMFGSVPGHPFWLEVIREMIFKSDTKIVNEEDILDSTGPGLLTDIYHHKKDSFINIEVLRNNLLCRSACETISCHFGDYAAHLHLGSWRWKV